MSAHPSRHVAAGQPSNSSTAASNLFPSGPAYSTLNIRSKDGTKLFVQRWQPSAPFNAHVLIVHGYFEHGGRYRHVAHRLAAFGIACTTIDLRGHGRSSGQRGYLATIDDYFDDIAAGWHLLEPQVPCFLLGHSMGGLLCLALAGLPHTAHFFNHPIQGLIVTNPFLAMTHPDPMRMRLGHLTGALLPRMSMPSGLAVDEISSDREAVQQYKQDPLIFSWANAGWFVQIQQLQQQIQRIHTFPMPIWFSYSDQDGIASPQVNQTFVEQLQMADKHIDVRLGRRHELLNEVDRDQLMDQLGQWMQIHWQHPNQT